MRRFWRIVALSMTAMLCAVLQVQANPASDVLRARASDELYNLDDEQALVTWRQATVADPQDAASWRGLASAILAHIAMLRGTMTVDSYLGRVTSKDVTMPPPPAALAKEFSSAVDRSIRSRQQLSEIHVSL